MKIDMLKWAKDLFPLNRSLTGKGTKKTLDYFKNINKEFKIISFKSGQKVLDWRIPLEWNVKDAYFEDSKKKKYAHFKKNNLHLLGYSYPIKKVVNKSELSKHLFTQKNQPDAIPYVTSYYKKRWGFCISENEKKKLLPGKYKVLINSKLKKGHLNLMHALIKGKSSKEIFFSSYVCHPSMANDQLSGPVLLNAIMKYVKSLKKRKYSYRFVLLPETIGSIAYLSRFKNQLKSKMIAGFNLTCVGDERAFSYVETPYGDTLADEALKIILKNEKNVKKYSFLDRASDERQYCAPGIDLPVCSFLRSKKYAEYHTNKDNFNVVTTKGLNGSFRVMKNLINGFEFGLFTKISLFPKAKYLCEPNLGKRNLYPTVSQKGSYDNVKLRTDILAYANGKNNIFKITRIIKSDLNDVIKELALLKDKKLII